MPRHFGARGFKTQSPDEISSTLKKKVGEVEGPVLVGRLAIGTIITS